LEPPHTVPFRPRRVAPRVCVVDEKPHIRTFLTDMLEDLGFITHECTRNDDVAAALATISPDLMVIGTPSKEHGATGVLKMLAAKQFRGNVMLFGGRSSADLQIAHELGENLRLAMLPPLGTPFRDSDLIENLSGFLPIRPSPAAPIDLGEALRNGWLELWYQPKIDPLLLSLRGAEALIRVRHPTLGIVAPSSFIPSDNDPHLRALSEFVVKRAMADWKDFAANRTPVELAINLPMPLLEDEDFVEHMRLHLPDHPAFPGLIVEVSSPEVVRDLDWARAIAKQIGAYNIRMSIEDLGAEGSSLARMPDFPFVELKVDWKLIDGCAEDLKRAVMSPILHVAERFGIPTVAVDVETRSDLHAARQAGFELVQGHLFAKPMEARKFARTMLARRGASFA
jgi:EAL domain-containing protein (putative c-di-GMP-specific phosphodiesterase class I)/CheY-like chemotaxis protein